MHPRNQNKRSKAATKAAQRKRWTRSTEENVAWMVPNFRRVIKVEFIAHAQRHGLTAASLLEDVLRDYLASQNIYIDERAKVEPPLPPPFTKRG